MGRFHSSNTRHIERRTNTAEGKMPKNSSSNATVKSNSSRQPETAGPNDSSFVQVENNMAKNVVPLGIEISRVITGFINRCVSQDEAARHIMGGV